VAHRILAVDNNPMNLEFLEYVLTSMGYEVETALSIEGGLAHMKISTPCLIISDLNLPYRDGFDFLRKVKQAEEWKDIPFVLISASSYLKADTEQAQRLGAAKFIFRPIEPQKLLDEIEPYLQACRIS
jgi:CheY-like chemotaxis protein